MVIDAIQVRLGMLGLIALVPEVCGSEVIQIFVVIEAIQVRLGMLGLIALVPEVCGK